MGLFLISLPAAKLLLYLLALTFTVHGTFCCTDVLTAYDYVVVGGGLSGLVVANRLTEDINTTVLVIEAGPLSDIHDPAISIPGLSSLASKYYWNFTALPLTYTLSDVAAPAGLAGKVVGGGSAVNGMFFDRASRADYDAWESLGNDGWGWDGLFDYFRKSEHFFPPSEQDQEAFGITWEDWAHGYEGNVRSSYTDWIYNETNNFFDAFHSLGIETPVDMADGDALGLYWSPSSIDPSTQTRSYSRTAYYEPAKNRTNLKLLYDNQVTKLLFSNTTAVGVQYAPNASVIPTTVYVNKEVIVSAGTFNTPKLFQLSGIGPASLLESLNIPIIVDLDGVGWNFQDHAFLSGYIPLNKSDYIDVADNATAAEEALQEYLTSRTGPYTAGMGLCAAFIPLSRFSNRSVVIASFLLSQNLSLSLPTISNDDEILLNGYSDQRFLLSQMINSSRAASIELSFGTNGYFIVALERPLSRGYVRINSTDPFEYPVIEYDTFKNPLEVEIVLDGLKFMLSVFETEPLLALEPMRDAEGALPPGDVTTDEQLRQWVLENITPTLAHPSCTCPMLKRDKGGVVNTHLQVYGTNNLRIVDASVFPLVPATHLQATVYAIAEKAADIIRGSS